MPGQEGPPIGPRAIVAIFHDIYGPINTNLGISISNQITMHFSMRKKQLCAVTPNRSYRALTCRTNFLLTGNPTYFETVVKVNLHTFLDIKCELDIAPEKPSKDINNTV